MDGETSAGVFKVRSDGIDRRRWSVLSLPVPHRGTAKRRSRCFSRALSATVAAASRSTTSPAARSTALFGEPSPSEVDSEEGTVDEKRLVTLEDVKG